VAPARAANIQFVGTQPASGLLVLKNTGGVGYSETSVVQFKVVDAAGSPQANQTVTFDLTTRLGGILLDGNGSGTVSKQTDGSGNVSVTVQSGTAPTAVWVTASLTGTTLSTQSNRLVISTGRPSQNFFSLSATTLNIDGFNFDGAQSTLTARVADRLGNLVPDGTNINFITEGARIISAGAGGGTPSATCATTNGSCSVILDSSEFRPSNGRVTVLAYALGEEAFVDANGDNYYTAGEAFTDLGDVFIDADESGTWSAGEQSIAFASNVAACGGGVLSRTNTCDGKWGQAHVRKDTVIVLSGTSPRTSTSSVSLGAGKCSGTFSIVLTDQNGNPMAAGTTLGISNVTSQFIGTTTKVPVTISPPAVGNTNQNTGTRHTITVDGSSVTGCTGVTAGSFLLDVLTPTAKASSSVIFSIAP